MPYVVSHRHAAGNWAQGVLVIKKSAAAKLANLKAHAGLPGQQPGWAGEWFAFHMVSLSRLPTLHFTHMLTQGPSAQTLVLIQQQTTWRFHRRITFPFASDINSTST